MKKKETQMNEGKIKTFWHVVENVKLRGNRHNVRMNEIQFWVYFFEWAE